METGTLFKMASVYGFTAASVCAVIAQRSQSEDIILHDKNLAVIYDRVAVNYTKNKSRIAL